MSNRLCYWKAPQKAYDINGREVLPGHLVELIDPDKYYDPWRYQVCFEDRFGIEIRDLCNNNIGSGYASSSPTGQGANLRILGHHTEHPDVLDNADREYYFGIPNPNA